MNKDFSVLFNENDFLSIYDNEDKILIKELANKSYLSDDEFEKYKDILKKLCYPHNPEKDDLTRNYMFKGFCKKGKYYNRYIVPKIVCITRCAYLEGEEWIPNKNNIYDVECGNIQVSNYGRVRTVTLRNSEKYFEILPQFENYEKDNKYDNSIDYADGYLCVNLPKEIKINDRFFSGCIEVYKLIAEFWLEKPIDYTPTSYQIHHINNNGYENTPANLIYLKTFGQHDQIH